MDQVPVGAATQEPPQPKLPQDDHQSGSILSKKKKSGRRRQSRKHSRSSASGKEHGVQPTFDAVSLGRIDAANAANISASVQGVAEAGAFPTSAPEHTVQPTATGEGQPVGSQPSLLHPPFEQSAAPQPTLPQPSLQQQLQPEFSLLQPGLPQEAVLHPTLPQALMPEKAGMLPENTGGIQQIPGGQTLLVLPPASSAPSTVMPGSFLYPQQQVLTVPVPSALYQQQPVPTTAFQQAAPGVDYGVVTPGPTATIVPAAPLAVVTGVDSVPSTSSLNAINGPQVTTVPSLSQDYNHILFGNENGTSGANRAEPNSRRLASKASVGKRGLAFLKSIFQSTGEIDTTNKSAPASGREAEKSPTGEYGEEIVDEQDEDSIASPVTRRSRSKSRAKSRSRTPKSRKFESVAQEKRFADTAASVGALRLDKDVVNKLLAALAARKQLTTEVTSLSPVQEQKDGNTAAGCIHRNAPCKAGHHQKKGAEELADSEDFFEEMVEEIVEPEEGTEDGPRKRIVRKTTKSRQHNVIEEPWEDKKRGNDLVTAIDRMQAIKSRLSASRRSDRTSPRYREDENSETTEAASFESTARTPSKFDCLCAYDDKEAMPAHVKKNASHVKTDERHAGLSFRPPIAPPWHRVPLPEGTCPCNVGIMRAPHLRPVPMHIGGCGRVPLLSPPTTFNSGFCRCPCQPAFYLNPSVPQQGCGCAPFPPCQHSLACAACNGQNKHRKNSQCGNIAHVGACYESFPGCAATDGHAGKMNGHMDCVGQSCVLGVCPCCDQTTTHHYCHYNETCPAVTASVPACSCLKSDCSGASGGVSPVPDLAGICDAAATAAIPRAVYHGTTAKRQGRPRRVVYRACPPPPGLPVIESPTQARPYGCSVPACAARTGGQTFHSHCQGGGTNPVSKQGVTLEEVLRREEAIRWDARLQERRQLLDEERIREEERLAFAEYVKEHEQPLENERQYLDKPEARRFLADLQREIARQKNSDRTQQKTVEEISGRLQAVDVTQSPRQPRVGSQVQSDGPAACVPSALVHGVPYKQQVTRARSKSVPGPEPRNVPRKSSLGPSAASAVRRTPEANGGRAAPPAARKPSIARL